MHRRTGTTLVEVLIAIFVMGIGLLAVLTLFPLGASNMAQAIKDDRSAHTAANARCLLEAFDVRNDPNVLAMYDNPDPNPPGAKVLPDLTTVFVPNPFWPNPPNPILPNPQVPEFVDYDGPSYPVYVDPFGAASTLGAFNTWVAGYVSNQPNQMGGVRRVTLSSVPVNQPALIMGYFTLPDDITFTPDAVPDLSTANVQRESKFSLACLLRRPRRADPSVVDVSVVVYYSRPLRLTTGLNPREDAYQAVFNTANNTVTLTWNPGAGQAAPTLRPGNWILDATLLPTTTPGPAGNPPRSVGNRPHGTFYRVTDVTQASTSTMELQIDKPLREFPANAQTPGVVLILDGVAEVLEMKAGWQAKQ